MSRGGNRQSARTERRPAVGSRQSETALAGAAIELPATTAAILGVVALADGMSPEDWVRSAIEARARELGLGDVVDLVEQKGRAG